MLVFGLFVISLACAHGLQVNTTEGVAEGSKAPDGNYYMFYGIPYAGLTPGNRFKGPVPPSKYPGLRFLATDSNVICAQPSDKGIIGTEDCLTLNVFTKNVTTSKPVIVWLNSEEYTYSYIRMLSFRKFVEHDVVFITMNFRLSIFGFLCLGVQEAPGNAGLRDVIQGLKWIKANIANFGGDPNNVMLMGHASGAAMVDLLTISPQTQNLVHKAISLSGSGLAPWAVAYDPVGYAEQLGAKLGYTGKTPADLAKHLITTDINVLNTALNEFKIQYNNTPLFAPCIENPKLKPNDTVLAEAPINVLRSGKYSQIPYIYGYTNLEGTMRADEADFGQWLPTMQANFTNFLQVDLQFGKNRTAEAANIRNYYFGSSPISMATIEDYLEYQGDTLVLVSTIKAAKERAVTSKSEVRLLEFGYMGTRNSDWIHNTIPLSGAKHGAFLNYMFDFDLKSSDEAVSNSIVKRIIGFAHNWNPAAAPPSARTSVWVPVTQNMTNYLYYGGNDSPSINNTNIYVEEPRFNPHVQRMSFWDNLYAKYYVAPPQASSSNVTFSCLFFVMLSQLLVRLF